ncbi:hypothetical protein [Ancylobacter polymorphus]|jgi:hypothetical protein|uniref:Uncharacterized protein n=1 Tax=Ancylobacter polymorphus TaxID=223390 RepID=A0A9E7D568_9HYPH|nr:hypothetical protein [Ancylobacter polymorphus]MDQ0303482.1 hypothetical protein [Ancylobacter polymorphus]MPT22259.1 hypothetical protein [Starkeya sp.]UOK70775.1 hypothetical protein K9D25_19000 [Ancylobacter polymorphus]
MELILSICLIASPGTCREEAVSVGLEAPPAPMQCMIGAMPVIAEWTETHPKWKVLKWRCASPGAGGREI